MVVPEFKTDLNRCFYSTGGFALHGWARDQEDAPVTITVPALEDTLLTDLHGGTSLKISVDGQFLLLYLPPQSP